MHAQDLGASLAIRRVNHDRAVESAGSEQSGVENVRAIGGGEDDDAFGARKAIHLGQDLIQRLLALVVSAQCVRATSTADGVDLVDENDGWSNFARFGEEFTDAAGSDADDH